VLIVPNALIYWPLIVFFLDLRREGPAFRRAVTGSHLFTALGVGAAACAIAFEASRRWPTAFGILATPLDVLMPIVAMLPGPRRPRSLVMWRLGGGLFAYAVLAFLALFRFRWRHSG